MIFILLISVSVRRNSCHILGLLHNVVPSSYSLFYKQISVHVCHNQPIEQDVLQISG